MFNNAFSPLDIAICVNDHFAATVLVIYAYPLQSI